MMKFLVDEVLYQSLGLKEPSSSAVCVCFRHHGWLSGLATTMACCRPFPTFHRGDVKRIRPAPQASLDAAEHCTESACTMS